MTFLERIFRKELISSKKSFTELRSSLIFFQPKSNKYTGKEYYPYSAGFNMYKYKDIYIANFGVLLKEHDLENKTYKFVTESIEVRMLTKRKPRQVIANKLLKLAVKELMKKYRPLGYKETLADYLYIDEIDNGNFRLELENTYNKFNKFISIRPDIR